MQPKIVVAETIERPTVVLFQCICRTGNNEMKYSTSEIMRTISSPCRTTFLILKIAGMIFPSLMSIRTTQKRKGRKD